MSETPRRILNLIVEGFPADRLKDITTPASGTNDVTEIFPLTEANTGEALGKIFSADTVAVWSSIE